MKHPNLNSFFDSTLLKADALPEAIQALCREAAEYHCYSVCINPAYIPLAAETLAGTDVKIATVIGFPLGASRSVIKALEARDAIEQGASEVDMVINVSAVKAGNYDYVKEDIAAVVQEAHTRQALVKVILETCLLTDEEIIAACLAARDAGADFVKTSTGFSTGGATIHAVSLMKQTVGDTMGIKASGGIRDLKTALAMIEAGATRLGCSACAKIIQENA